MSSLGSMYAMLQPLRLYALRTGSLIDAELHAYGAAFALLEGGIESAAGSAHPQLADEYALGMHERAVGLPVRRGVDPAERQELILRRLAMPYPPTLAGALQTLAACGMTQPQITETGGGLAISFGGAAQGMSFDECWQLALRALPAHLPVFIAGLSWDELEAPRRTWDELDALGVSWAELALAGNR